MSEPSSALKRPNESRRGDAAIARRVIELEAESLRSLAAAIDTRFADAVTLLNGIKGRVVVSGMGKSGHVARKIAATLASTGAPATFVHPAEASHGDLGMITRDDALLILSKSGETAELADAVQFAKRRAIPLIAMVGRANSTLADAADIPLILPDAPEACPLGLAPTTSTTMMLALGDALAVALLERKGFTASDFQAFHPGGRLGSQLVRVSQIMHHGDAVPLVNIGTPMADALIVMTGKGFGCVGVLDGMETLTGVVTDGDLRRHMGSGLLDKPAEQIMTGQPKTIRADAFAAEALNLMNERKITSLFVVDGARVVGILHVHDCLRAGLS
jgi:arabinose-5-phosphate isomerase